jgi:hypothetical protein
VREKTLVLAHRTLVMTRDKTHDALGRAIFTRHLRAAARVVEVTRERRTAPGETRAHARSEPEQHARDAVPEERVRGFRGVVEEARDDELFIRAQLPKDARGLGRMTVVRAG